MKTPMFLLSLKGEVLKTKRTIVIWLILGGAAFIPLVNFTTLVAKPAVFVPKMKAAPWPMFLDNNWAVLASMLLPIFVVVMTTALVQIETGNNTWKQVLTSPRAYLDILISKFLLVHIVLIFSCILFITFILLTAFTANLIVPDYTFVDNPIPWNNLFTTGKKLYLSMLGLSAIQFGLSLKFKNMMMPIGIGIAGIIIGFMLLRWEYSAYWPYSHAFMVYHPKLVRPGVDEQALFLSPVYCAALLPVIFAEFFYRREKG